MNADQLLQHFERISEAPDAIPRLRCFILDLAVRGKLVEQDPSDEPAAELLKRIAAEKSRVGRRKTEQVEIDNREELGVLPPLWCAVPLIALGSWAIGTGFPKNEQGMEAGLHFFLKVSDMNLPGNDKYITTSNNLIDDDAVRRMRAKIHPKGTIIFPKIGGAIATNKRRILTRGSAIDNNCLGITFSGELNTEWAFLLLTKLDFTRYQAGSAVPALQQGVLERIPVALPPLAEQHRIVAKVDELMNLCDQLEAAKAEREQCRDSLVAASLQRLNQPVEEEETSREHARFTFNNLPRITIRVDHIKQLRQTILNLAVRGKLVEQDPSDEPAAELLKRIATEKARLVKEKKIKRPPTVASIDPANSPFILPENWVRVRIGEVYDVRDGTHDSPRYQAEGYPLITSKDFVDGRISFENCKYITREDHEKISQRSKVDAGDILFSMIGGNIGNMVLVDSDREFSIKNVALFKYFSLDLSLPNFLKVVLKDLSEDVQQKAIGGAQPFVSLGFLRGALIGLPPLAEQHRIVAKVDELMSLCDQLEAQITATEQDSRRFLESVLADALAPGIECNHH
jgi:type I restriction enzyme, S subunit